MQDQKWSQNDWMAVYLVHVKAAMRKRKWHCASAHGLWQHLPSVPLGLVDLQVHSSQITYL